MKMPKISLGVTTKKYHHDLTHDVNTTSGFGFCQPTIGRELVPQTTVSLRTKSFVRLGAMPTPSFARVSLRTFTSFVPLHDVFEASRNFLSGEPYRVSTHVNPVSVTSTDFITLKGLLSFVLGVRCRPSSYTTAPDRGNQDWIYFMPCLWEKSNGSYRRFDLSSSSVFNDLYFPSELFKTSFYDVPSPSTPNPVTTETFKERIIEMQNIIDGQSTAHWYGHFKPTFDNADFVFECNRANTYITFHATPSGRNLLKIFNGLSINFYYLSKRCPLTLFYAYYKAWFDVFNVGRVRNWYQTPCYQLIHTYYDYPQCPMDSFLTDSTIVKYPSVPFNTSQGFFVPPLNDFFYLLTQCYHVDVSDPYTACTESVVDTTFREDISPLDNSFPSNTISFGGHSYPFVSDGTLDSISSLDSFTLKTLQKLLPYVNRNTIIGKRLEEYLRVNFNISIHSSSLVNASRFNITIDDIFNQSSSPDAHLGEYAGKGQGYGESPLIKVSSNDDFGYLIQFSCIVPEGGYSQGFNNTLSVNFDDFYQPAFDGLGMEAVPKSELYSECNWFSKSVSRNDVTFGFRPRFSRLKFSNNVRSGDFARRATIPYMMPYCLDRYFTPPSESSPTGVRPVVSEFLRYKTIDESYGNYNRLFFDNDSFNDNFIIHMLNDMSMVSPLKPLSQSYDTFDEDSNDNTVKTEHV